MYMNKCVRGNASLCMGCRTCLIACVEAHSDKPVYELKPDSINFNPKLHMIKSYDVTVPYQCRHCENPECMKVCTKGAIYIEDGKVLVDYEKCDGCGDCAEACPFGAIDIKPLSKEAEECDATKCVANKCDLCKDNPEGPACVKVCPTKALSVVETDEIIETVEERRALELYRSSLKQF